MIMFLLLLLGVQSNHLISFAPSAHAAIDPPFSHVYFGFSEEANGRSDVGNTFIVLTKNPKEFLGGKVYQYNARLPSDYLKIKAKTKFEYLRALYAKLTRVSVNVDISREDAFIFLNRYAKTNYLTTLFKLNMNPEQIHAVQKTLERDYEYRFTNPSVINFSILRTNTFVRSIDFLNSVIDKKEQVEVNLKTDQTNILSYFTNNAWISNIPISLLSDLRKDSFINKEGTFSIKPNSGTRDKITAAISIELKKIGVICEWSDEKEQNIRHYLFDDQTRYLLSFQDYLASELVRCKSKGLRSELETFTDLLFLDLNEYSKLPAAEQKPVRKWIRSLALSSKLN